MSKSASKRLYILGSFFTALSLTGAVASIWTSDERWGQTAGTLAIAAFIAGACGVFANIHEDFS